jgi:hypothetical protein
MEEIRHDFRQRTDQRCRDKAKISDLCDGRGSQFAPGMARVARVMTASIIQPIAPTVTTCKAE